jgi:hypothetical protein
MTIWEYLRISVSIGPNPANAGSIQAVNGHPVSSPPPDLDRYLAELGNQGWELVTIYTTPYQSHNMLFKRPRE